VAADRVRAALELSSGQRFPIDRFVRFVENGQLSVEPGIHAAGRADKSAVVLNRRPAAPARRFTLARALWHVLIEPESLFLVTAAHTDRQRAERAFAAELLAPAAGVADRLAARGASDVEDVDEVARSYGVSAMVIEHQIENQLVEL